MRTSILDLKNATLLHMDTSCIIWGDIHGNVFLFALDLADGGVLRDWFKNNVRWLSPSYKLYYPGVRSLVKMFPGEGDSMAKMTFLAGCYEVVMYDLEKEFGVSYLKDVLVGFSLDIGWVKLSTV